MTKPTTKLPIEIEKRFDEEVGVAYTFIPGSGVSPHVAYTTKVKDFLAQEIAQAKEEGAREELSQDVVFRAGIRKGRQEIQEELRQLLNVDKAEES